MSRINKGLYSSHDQTWETQVNEKIKSEPIVKAWSGVGILLGTDTVIDFGFDITSEISK